MPVYGRVAIVPVRVHSWWKAWVLFVPAALLMMPHQIYYTMIARLSAFDIKSTVQLEVFLNGESECNTSTWTDKTLLSQVFNVFIKTYPLLDFIKLECSPLTNRLCINTSRHFSQFVQWLELRSPLSLARRDLSITESLAAAFAHLDCLCFAKNGERCDEDNGRVNGGCKRGVNIREISGDGRKRDDERRCWEKSLQGRKKDCGGKKMFAEKNETEERTEDRNSPREKSLKEAICECGWYNAVLQMLSFWDISQLRWCRCSQHAIMHAWSCYRCKTSHYQCWALLCVNVNYSWDPINYPCVFFLCLSHLTRMQRD